MGADDTGGDEAETPDAEAWREDEVLAKHFDDKAARKKKSRRRGRNPLPEHLPREEIVLSVPKPHRVCSVCGSTKQCVGHHKSEVLEWVPGSFKVLVFACEKIACKPCQGEISIAPVADKIIEGGLPAPGLLAEVALKKYKYAVPPRTPARNCTRNFRRTLSFSRAGQTSVRSSLASCVVRSSLARRAARRRG